MNIIDQLADDRDKLRAKLKKANAKLRQANARSKELEDALYWLWRKAGWSSISRPAKGFKEAWDHAGDLVRNREEKP